MKSVLFTFMLSLIMTCNQKLSSNRDLALLEDFPLPINWTLSYNTDNRLDSVLRQPKIGVLTFRYKDSVFHYSIAYRVFERAMSDVQFADRDVIQRLNAYTFQCEHMDPFILSNFMFHGHFYLLDTIETPRPPTNRLSYNLLRYSAMDGVRPTNEGLTATNYITVLSVLVVVFGWFINNILNRRHEISKERFKLRMEMFRSCLEVYYITEKSERYWLDSSFDTQLTNAERNFLSFGSKKEMDSFRRFKGAIQVGDYSEAKVFLDLLINESRSAMKQELKLG